MEKSKASWSRRNFLSTVAGAGAGILLRPFPVWARAGGPFRTSRNGDPDPRVAEIVAATIGIDTHNHIDVPLIAGEVPGPQIDLAGEMKRSGLSAICMTFAVDYQKLTNPGDAYDRFRNGLASMDEELRLNDMRRALSVADLRDAHAAHKPVVIQSVEGAHFLEGHVERLGEAYGRGLRHLGLLHDSDASVPLGDVYTNPPRWGGLTAFGSDVIRECNRLGILVDLAHANTETTAAALKVAAHPVIISHTGLDTRLGNNPRMAQMMRPRLISKEQAKMVADAGGIIGVWTHLADSALEYAQNIRALADVVGVDHVGIGTDTKLTPGNRPGPRPGGPGGPGANGGPAGNGAPGGSGGPGGQNQQRAGERTNQAWEGQQTGFYYAVVEAMLKTGFTADEIGKIGGGNFCRIFDAATAGHS